MAETTPQSFDNHAKLVPLFHNVALPIFLINLIISLVSRVHRVLI